MEAEFDRFVIEFGKLYENEAERAFRLQVFREVRFTLAHRLSACTSYKCWVGQSLARIAELNEGEPHAPFGVTAFADMTQHEFAVKYMIGPEYINQHAVETAGVLVLPQLSLQDLPLEFDWRSVNGTSYVTPVKNQGGVLMIQINKIDLLIIA